jgi:hypothetical protein
MSGAFDGRALAALAAVVWIGVACGGRNLENLDQATGAAGAGGGDGGGGTAGSGADGGGGRGGMAAGGATTGGEGGSTGPGNPIDCFGCIAENCPQAVECLTDQACLDGIICGVTNCLAGGGGSPDIGCFVDCFNGDFEAALNAFETITCVLGSCGDACGGFLGGGFP